MISFIYFKELYRRPYHLFNIFRFNDLLNTPEWPNLRSGPSYCHCYKYNHCQLTSASNETKSSSSKPILQSPTCNPSYINLPWQISLITSADWEQFLIYCNFRQSWIHQIDRSCFPATPSGIAGNIPVISSCWTPFDKRLSSARIYAHESSLVQAFAKSSINFQYNLSGNSILMNRIIHSPLTFLNVTIATPHHRPKERKQLVWKVYRLSK